MKKRSAYNRIVKAEGKWLIYNFFTQQFSELTEREKEEFERDDILVSNSPFAKECAEKGFLIDSDYDELHVLREEVQEAVENTDRLVLQIAPTMNCNMGCPYCFEEGRHRNTIMSDEVQRAVIDFVKKCMKKYGCRTVTGLWYGGEPLLALDVVEKLSKEIADIAKENGAEYSATILTNGYFLDDAAVKRLKGAGITGATVTVDGPAEIHNQSRVLKNGKGSFDRIQSNLKGISTEFNVLIRTNYHRGNIECMDWMNNWVEELETSSQASFKAKASFVNCANPVFGESADVNVLSQKEFEKTLKEHCAGDDLRECRATHSCLGCRESSFAIDELGNLYKCGDFVGDDAMVFGTVFDYEPESEECRNAEELNYRKRYAFPEKEECLSCQLLPFCLGGCPKARKEYDACACMIGREEPDAFVLRQYNVYKKQG